MKFTDLYDMHTHSINSFDGHDQCFELVESLISKGGKGIAVTDHCDIDGEDLDIDALCTAQLNDLDNCVEKYKNTDIIKGIEIGQGIYKKEETENLLKKYDYDFVLGSLHNLYKTEDFYYLDYTKYDVYDLLQKYFEGLLELTQWGAFDSLAHLTYPLRYMVSNGKPLADVSRFDGIIDIILENLVKNNKALEINTSGLYTDIKDTYPNIKYIKRFKQLGGEYITVGSDSHYAEKVLQSVDRGYEIALKSGFEYVTVYKKHQPLLIEIK